jgi:hypothetical protein
MPVMEAPLHEGSIVVIEKSEFESGDYLPGVETGNPSIVQPGCTKLVTYRKRIFQQPVEREQTERITEPWEIFYFKLYRSQMRGIERAIETAALMLGTDKSRGYCLEIICADFLAGANLDNGEPATLLFSMTRFFKFLPGEHAGTTET